ncbi:MAG: hypothetical protein ACFFHV_13240, partial [Promethearchaeota archaeon]
MSEIYDLRDFYSIIFNYSISLIFIIILLIDIRLRLKYGKILNREVFLKNFLEQNEEILWTERQNINKLKLKIFFSILGITLLSILVILVFIISINKCFNSEIFSKSWWNGIVSLVYYSFITSTIIIVILLLLIFRDPLSNKVVYYLSNKRMFSTYMRTKFRHIMVFNTKIIQFYDFKEKLNPNLYNFYFKTSELSIDEIESSILKLIAKKDQMSTDSYEIKITIDDGWNWSGESKECIIRIKN